VREKYRGKVPRESTKIVEGRTEVETPDSVSEVLYPCANICLMSPVADKKEIARSLAQTHVKTEPSISRIVRLLAGREEDPNEPVKLLEVNSETSPSGIIPISFGANPPRVPFPSVIIEVTESEFAEIQSGKMSLPEGWRMGETLFELSAAY
jgi:hypothetical protein